MINYDVFNGDADGICALVQLRLAEPKESQLITGVKRDINLLRRVQASAGDRITVLDISMAKNQADLQRLHQDAEAARQREQQERRRQRAWHCRAASFQPR